MSVWRPVDSKNMGAIVHRKDDFEVIQAPSGQLWYRHRSDQEAAELRVLYVERNPDQDRLDNALKIAPPP